LTYRVGNPLFLAFIYSFIFIVFCTHLLIKIFRPLFKLKLQIKVRFAPLYIVSGFVIVIALGVASVWVLLFADLPDAEDLSRRDQEVSTKIYDRNGVLLYKIYKDKNRTPVKLGEVPRHVIQATLAIEDAEFYNHPGFSVRGIARAMVKNIREGKLTGGSTITQQLVKNTLLTPEKTLLRKLREVIVATRVENAFSKDEILEMYLNEVSYGGTAYGIEEASQHYFGKNVTKLTLAEAALLAGLSKSPSAYSPFGANPELAVWRQREVLREMEENGFITYEQRMEAQRQKLVYASNITDIKAPHFVMYVRRLLAEQFGEEMVEKGGLEVITTLDVATQVMAEEVVRAEVEKIANLKVSNGAAIVMKPATGEILAMVGSTNYWDREKDGNVNVTIRPRSPGSSIKIVTYGYALSNGYTASTILNDSPFTVSIPGSKPYSPKNYDGRYRGRLTLRSAFAESRNVPAVRTIVEMGVGNVIDLGQNMGITTWGDRSRFGPAITLGGGEVTLLDLSQVYATVANYGKRPNKTAILQVKDYKGKVLIGNECLTCEQPEVMDPRVAFILTDSLADNRARTPAFGANSSLVIAGHGEVAVKTGTSNNLRDNLTVGYNQFYLVGVWVGNNDNSPMSRVASGVTGAAPIWNKIMSNLIANAGNHPWEVPAGLVRKVSGCPPREEWFLEENQQITRCPTEEERKKQEEQRDSRGRITQEAWRN